MRKRLHRKNMALGIMAVVWTCLTMLVTLTPTPAAANGFGSLGDFVWNDLNYNGIQDTGEPGLAGVTVTLRDASSSPLATTATDANGNYSFNFLSPAVYSMQFSLLPGFIFSPQYQGGDPSLDSNANAAGFTDLISLTSGEVNNTIDAGMALPPSGKIGDFVWNDLNYNGIQDAGEPGLAGVTVALLDAGSSILATTTTDGSGKYFFTNLLPDDYLIKFSLLTDYVFSPQYQGGDPSLDSNANAAGLTDLISLAANEENFTIDGGMHQVVPAPLPGSLLLLGSGLLSVTVLGRRRTSYSDFRK